VVAAVALLAAVVLVVLRLRRSSPMLAAATWCGHGQWVIRLPLALASALLTWLAVGLAIGVSTLLVNAAAPAVEASLRLHAANMRVDGLALGPLALGGLLLGLLAGLAAARWSVASRRVASTFEGF
jgi:hypothetical protein